MGKTQKYFFLTQGNAICFDVYMYSRSMQVIAKIYPLNVGAMSRG